MNVGSLFILFGVKTDADSFRAGMKQLYALQAVASTVTGVLRGVGEGLVHMALGAAESATHILGTAAGLGMSAESFQKWSYVARQAGGDATQVARGIGMLERNLHAFAEGRASKSFKDAMHHIGVTQQQARDAMTGKDGINGAIFLVSDGYKRLGLSAQTAAINQSIAGARNREFLQDLGKGSEFLKGQFRHFEQIGGVVSEDKLQNLKRFNNSVDDLKTSFGALGMQVVGDLAPKFSKMIDKVTAWIGENKEMISDVLTVAFKVVAFAFEVIADVIKRIADLIHGVMNGDDGAIIAFTLMAALVTTVAIAITSMLIPTIVAMGAALIEAMLPILPWTLLLGGIIVLVILIVKHWDQIRAALRAFGREVRDLFNWFGGVLSKSVDGFAKLGRFIADAFLKITHTIGDAVISIVGHIVEKFIQGINFIIRGLNKLPRVNIGQIDVPEWAKHNTAVSETHVEYSDIVGRPGARPGTHVNYRDIQPFKQSTNNSVSVAPTTVNIYGVKDADQAGKHISDAIDAQHRHAFAALGGE